jgi:hypothetical protein
MLEELLALGHSARQWDREFESRFLQRGVCCEPDLLDQGAENFMPSPIRPSRRALATAPRRASTVARRVAGKDEIVATRAIYLALLHAIKAD